jgi:hypothetical protein
MHGVELSAPAIGSGLPKRPRTRVVPIHTSDRANYKSCRRRWLWGSHLNRGLEPASKASPLWFGEGFHFALKEFHGYRQYGTIHDAFIAFVEQSYEEFPKSLPMDTPELITLGGKMLDHYMWWLQRRDPLHTYVINGIPQCEVTFEIDMTEHIPEWILDAQGIAKVVYRGTFDRISIDANGHLWIVEYKTAKVISTAHLMLDPQVSAYCFAASCLYELPLMGVIYQQHKKDWPKDARILKSGEVSIAKNQSTTHRLYRQALIENYGPKESGLWSPEHIDMLNKLAGEETVDKDPFINRTKVYRSTEMMISEGRKMLGAIAQCARFNLRARPLMMAATGNTS